MIDIAIIVFYIVAAVSCIVPLLRVWDKIPHVIVVLMFIAQNILCTWSLTEGNAYLLYVLILCAELATALLADNIAKKWWCRFAYLIYGGAFVNTIMILLYHFADNIESLAVLDAFLALDIIATALLIALTIGQVYCLWKATNGYKDISRYSNAAVNPDKLGLYSYEKNS